MDVYLDLVVILNFLVDFLLLLGTNHLAGFHAGAKKAALAAGVGGIYAVACVLPGWHFLGNIFWRIVSLGIMSVIAFGWSKGALRRGILFVFLSMALGGIALGMGNGGFWAVVLGALGVAILCVVGFCGKSGAQQYVNVRICHDNRQLHLTALQDTGNTLRDPVTGLPVLVADATAAAKLLDLSPFDVMHPVETMTKFGNRGLRLVPYHAVGQPNGLMLATSVDSLEIDGKKCAMVVAFAPQTIGQGKVYQALSGGCVP